MIRKYAAQAGITRRRIDKRALEGCPVKEAAFLLQPAGLSPQQCIFIDKTRIDECMVNPNDGRAIRARRSVVRHKFNRGRSFFACGVLTTEGLLDVPSIKGANSIIVWDHPGIHKTHLVLDAIAERGMFVMNTPPDSPWYQPCKYLSGAVKRLLRSHLEKWHNTQGPCFAIEALFYEVVPDSKVATRFVQHCGYGLGQE
ncbi:hypothetical protein JCM10450v2_007225 [Rhodotorula kratochvilovae]